MTMTVFEDRRDAGRRLAAALQDLPALSGDARVVVLAIPRGGLPVGAEVARALGADFDVVVVRKLRSPNNPELGFGAVGADGHVELDGSLVSELGLTPDQVEAEIVDRTAAVQQRLELYRGVVPAVDLDGAVVIVVDDGIATGGTARHACLLARRGGAVRVILAVPVAPRSVKATMEEVADDVVILSSPAEFLAVDQGYRDFVQLDDDAALAALADSRQPG
jgi:putative phosphoribosyl transferase